MKLEKRPEFAIKFIEQYLPTAWSDGIRKKSEFELMQYDSIVKLVEPQYILSAVEAIRCYKTRKRLSKFRAYPFREKIGNAIRVDS